MGNKRYLPFRKDSPGSKHGAIKNVFFLFFTTELSGSLESIYMSVAGCCCLWQWIPVIRWCHWLKTAPSLRSEEGISWQLCFSLAFHFLISAMASPGGINYFSWFLYNLLASFPIEFRCWNCFLFDFNPVTHIFLCIKYKMLLWSWNWCCNWNTTTEELYFYCSKGHEHFCEYWRYRRRHYFIMY